jgi:hypothetical protein
MQNRHIFEIAREIGNTWPSMNYAAKPYYEAMLYLMSINDTYGADSAKSIVMYFLSNASTWRGEHARRIKAELRELVSNA